MSVAGEAMTKLESDLSHLGDEAPKDDAFVAFKVEMEGRAYGREALCNAWHYFSSGYHMHGAVKQTRHLIDALSKTRDLEAENAKLRAALDAAADALKELTWRVVANAGRLSEERKPRWSHVSDATAHGSTVSAALCASAGFDPDENRGGGE